jgi:phage-related minor tail protein
MTDIKLTVDATALKQEFGAASAEISRVAREEIAPAAALIETAFAGVARSIERDLARAARSGELSLKGLARSIVNDLKRVAIDTLVRNPIESFLSNLFKAPFGGGRAHGGAVARGQSYLVGERGPEIFTPAQSGRIGRPEGRGVSVNITLPGVTTPESFRQSQTQIAAALQRALQKGARNL